MKKIIKYQVTIFVFFVCQIKYFAQYDYPMAKEIWSEPEVIKEFSDPHHIFEHPTLNNALDTIYMGLGNGIYRSVLNDGKWTEPEFIPQLHHGGAATRHPSLSRDSKRIYFSDWGGYGNWDIYISHWIDSLKSWSVSENMGPVINSPGIEWFAHEVSEDTLYIIGSEVATLGKIRYVKNHLTDEWQLDDDFYNDGGNFSGLSVTGNRKKMYFSQWSPSWTETEKIGPELCVSYWDTINKNWNETYFLNINSVGIPLDSNWDNTLGGWDGHPWITMDGKILFFSSSRLINWVDSINTHDIFVSYLLVDENGDTVTSIRRNEKPLYDFKLLQNYPNPFNPSTKIEYQIKKQGYVRLIIYNSIGQKICQLINEEKNIGYYSIEFNPQLYSISSGTYYYQLFHNGHYSVKKMQYLK